MTILQVKNLKTLNALPNHSDGEIAYCKDEKKYYEYKNNEWVEVVISNAQNNIQLSAYDLNQQVYAQLQPLTADQKAQMMKDINDWKNGDNYLLYSKTLSWFTFFEKGNAIHYTTLGQAVVSYLNECEFDTIYSYEPVDDANMEIWVKDIESGNAEMFMLMNWDGGVIKYEE